MADRQLAQARRAAAADPSDVEALTRYHLLASRSGERDDLRILLTTGGWDRAILAAQDVAIGLVCARLGDQEKKKKKKKAKKKAKKKSRGR